ncbi:hypothetical protein PoB_007081400 [Plakobranchus ocellatus]|uniref:Uncharacterized protein n=1 Tax=Plakobranchus ocellatus TaxID=259542 RepID=A0AAV4DJV0_9GAST|nr:hypothetical protein PoB_007081400 [Plakobranchus ocellatus]
MASDVTVLHPELTNWSEVTRHEAQEDQGCFAAITGGASRITHDAGGTSSHLRFSHIWYLWFDVFVMASQTSLRKMITSAVFPWEAPGSKARELDLKTGWKL